MSGACSQGVRGDSDDEIGEGMRLVARGDESGSDRSRDPGTTLTGVVLVEEHHLDALTGAMEALRPRRGAKLHWRDATSDLRLKAIETLCTQPIVSLVVVHCRPQSTERPERRRRHCLNTLLPELDRLGCSSVVWESRGRADDRRDLDALAYLRTRGEVSTALRLDHTIGHQDPSLWAADVLCGAVVTHRAGHPREPDYLAILSSTVPVDILQI